MAIEKALELAKKDQLDLCEVSPNSVPPVCKVMDYGKHQYHQKKIDTKHRKMQKKTETKGVRLGFKIGDHDMEVRRKQAEKFLLQGNMVKVALIFKGREAMYKHLAKDKMLQFYDQLEEIAVMELAPKSQGNTLIMILTPKK